MTPKKKPARTDRCVATPCLSPHLLCVPGDLGRLYHRRRAAAVNTSIPPGSESQQRRSVHSAALASSDLRHRDNCCCASDRQNTTACLSPAKCDVAVNARPYRSGGLLPAVVCHPPSPPVDRGHSEAAPPRALCSALRCSCAPPPPLLLLPLLADNGGAQCASSDRYTHSAGGKKPTLCPNSRIK